MNNFEIIIAIVFVALFIGGCGTERIFVNTDTAEMLAFFDRTNNIIGFIQEMQKEGFHYHNEINDLNFYTDRAPSPEVTYERKWANCNGFTTFIKAFLKYKGCFDNIKTISLRQRGVAGVVTAWHYLLVVQVGPTLYETSNMQIRIIDNITQSQVMWASMGYSEFEIVEEIKK